MATGRAGRRVLHEVRHRLADRRGVVAVRMRRRMIDRFAVSAAGHRQLNNRLVDVLGLGLLEAGDV